MAVEYHDRALLPGHTASAYTGDLDYALALFQPATLTVSGQAALYGVQKSAWTRLNHTAMRGDASVVVTGQVSTLRACSPTCLHAHALLFMYTGARLGCWG